MRSPALAAAPVQYKRPGHSLWSHGLTPQTRKGRGCSGADRNGPTDRVLPRERLDYAPRVGSIFHQRGREAERGSHFANVLVTPGDRASGVTVYNTLSAVALSGRKLTATESAELFSQYPDCRDCIVRHFAK